MNRFRMATIVFLSLLYLLSLGVGGALALKVSDVSTQIM